MEYSELITSLCVRSKFTYFSLIFCVYYNVCPFGNMPGVLHDIIVKIALGFVYICSFERTVIWFDNLSCYRMSYHCPNSSNPWINVLLQRLESYWKYRYRVLSDNHQRTIFEKLITNLNCISLAFNRWWLKLKFIWNPSEGLMHAKLK